MNQRELNLTDETRTRKHFYTTPARTLSEQRWCSKGAHVPCKMAALVPDPLAISLLRSSFGKPQVAHSNALSRLSGRRWLAPLQGPPFPSRATGGELGCASASGSSACAGCSPLRQYHPAPLSYPPPGHRAYWESDLVLLHSPQHAILAAVLADASVGLRCCADGYEQSVKGFRMLELNVFRPFTVTSASAVHHTQIRRADVSSEVRNPNVVSHVKLQVSKRGAVNLI